MKDIEASKEAKAKLKQREKQKEKEEKLREEKEGQVRKPKEKKELKEKEEEEKPKEKKTPVGEKPSVERTYIVPLAKAMRKPASRRANAATKLLREFIARHMKNPKVKIDEKVNNEIRTRGARKPLKKVKVTVSKEIDGTIYVNLAEG